MTRTQTISQNLPLVIATDHSQPWGDVCTPTQLHLRLISAAAAAPSADNNQPWKFATTTRGLIVYCDLARRLPSDVDGMFDLLALGAAIENIAIELSSCGQQARVTLRDQETAASSGLLRPIARVEFAEAPAGHTPDRLATQIFERHTTRLPFARTPIPTSQLEEITKVAICEPGVQLSWVQDRSKIKKIAALTAISDSLRFRYRDFHEELHRQLRLTPEHAERTRDGLDYRTLGLPPGASWVLRAMRPWSIMSLLNRCGIVQLLTMPGADLVRRSGAIGFLYVDNRSTTSLIAGGRAMQRMWLQATQLGLCVQPLGSLPIFLANQSLPEELKTVADRMHKLACELLPAPGSFLQMAFRIGINNKPTAVRSLRRPATQLTIASTIKGKHHVG